MTELAHGRTRSGEVSEFDADRGLGVIRSDDGDDHRFHCVEIADGSRGIAVGTRVDFALLPKLGRLEAADIRGMR